MEETFTREIARCSEFDVSVEDHGALTMYGSFEYDGGGQGLGYVIDAQFIKNFLGVFRVSRLRQVTGRYCWVTHSHSSIIKLEPVLPNDGTEFDIAAWVAVLKASRGKG